MANTENLTLYTAQTSYFDPNGHESPQSFKRVVGIESNGEELWTEICASPDSPGTFVPEQATPMELEVPQWFSERIIDYFATHLIVRKMKNEHNCHHFAAHMIGESPRDASPLTVVTRGQRTEPPLRLGQRGVIGMRSVVTGTAPHTVIGLGEDRDKCIQVMTFGGFMGITSYEAILWYYRRRSSRIGIYTNEQSPSTDEN